MFHEVFCRVLYVIFCKVFQVFYRQVGYAGKYMIRILEALRYSIRHEGILYQCILYETF